MLTHEQLEVAARKLCALLNEPPDALVTHSAEPSADGSIPGVLLRSPRWRVYMGLIMLHEQIADAIAHARAQTTGKPVLVPGDDGYVDLSVSHARSESESGEARKMVPREPTEDMIRVGLDFVVMEYGPRAVWQAMWDAAPRGE